MKESNIKNRKIQHSIPSYLFRCYFGISSQTLNNWERRDKIQIIRWQLHHLKLRNVNVETLKNIPQRYKKRIEYLHQNGEIENYMFQLIIKGFK